MGFALLIMKVCWTGLLIALLALGTLVIRASSYIELAIYIAREPLINYMMLLAYRLIRDQDMTLKAGWAPVEKS